MMCVRFSIDFIESVESEKKKKYKKPYGSLLKNCLIELLIFFDPYVFISEME